MKYVDWDILRGNYTKVKGEWINYNNMLGISTYYARRYTTLYHDPLVQGHSYDVISVTSHMYVPSILLLLPIQ